MAEEKTQEDFQQDYYRRRERLEAFKTDINSTLDYFAQVPDSEGGERDQKSGYRRDMEKLRNRISDFMRELE